MKQQQKNFHNFPDSTKGHRLFRPLKFYAPWFLCSSILLFIYSVNYPNFSYRCFESIEKCNNIFSVIQILKKQFSLWFQKKQEMASEIEILQHRINQYENELFDYQTIKEENAYLNSILPIVHDLKTVTIIQNPVPAQPFVSVSNTLPKSALQQIHIDAPVVSHHGLFGYVIYKGTENIMIRLATHVQSRIPVRSSQSQKKAILIGNNSLFFKIKYTAPLESDETVFQQNCEKPKLCDFVEGELLETLNQNPAVPVAKIERSPSGKLRAKWVGNGNLPFITVIIAN